MKLLPKDCIGIAGAAFILGGAFAALTEHKVASFSATFLGLWGVGGYVFLTHQQHKYDIKRWEDSYDSVVADFEDAEADFQKTEKLLQETLQEKDDLASAYLSIEAHLAVTKSSIANLVHSINRTDSNQYVRFAIDELGQLVISTGDISELKPRHHFYGTEGKAFENARHFKAVFSLPEINQADGDR